MELSRYLERGEFSGFVLGAFILGIAAHSFAPFWHASEVWMAVGLGGCGLAVAMAYPRKPRFQIAVLILAVALGFWRFNSSVPQANDGILPFMGNGIGYEGIVEKLSVSKTYSSAVVKIISADDRKISGPGERLVIRLKQTVEVGTEISFTCSSRKPTTFPSNFDRRKSLARKGVWAECTTIESLAISKQPSPFDPLVILARWRETLTRRISGTFPLDEAMLLSGILYGDQDLSDEQYDLFQRSGLMHIVAVSGSNVTIVVSVVLGLVLALGFSRRHAFWLATLGLLVFIGFVGFGASVLRAAAMGWLAILARYIGRPVWTDRLLIVAAAVLNLMNPWLLAFDPGFALSFLATWGLLSWTPVFQERLRFMPNIFSLRETLATTLGATIMTVPYLAWAFGRMSLAGLITNALALPLIPWTMMWGAMATVWGRLPGQEFVSWPTFGLLRLIIKIAHLADVLPWLNLKVPYMEWAAMVGCYILLWQLWRAVRSEESMRNKKEPVDSDVELG
ncbi:ComEC/Rec2 family competence protein [Candidatus Uhrbacteria bacterium]|nr:ComEC/Rec2 family competence protein [Candidatus Uhrbacteria bacterium]